MIKILHTGDIHLGDLAGPTRGGANLRRQDTLRCMDAIVNKARTEGPTVTIIAGDLFNRSRVWADTALDDVNDAISRFIVPLCEYSDAVVLLFGTMNHDKTPKSNRVVQMPSFLCEEMQDYIKLLYEVQPNDRIFQITKSYLFREMQRGCKETGVKRIKIHGLRHSHISLLIDMGFSALAIADRVGHESIDITYHYAHLFPTRQTEMANQLDMERKGSAYVCKES